MGRWRVTDFIVHLCFLGILGFTDGVGAGGTLRSQPNPPPNTSRNQIRRKQPLLRSVTTFWKHPGWISKCGMRTHIIGGHPSCAVLNHMCNSNQQTQKSRRESPYILPVFTAAVSLFLHFEPCSTSMILKTVNEREEKS